MLRVLKKNRLRASAFLLAASLLLMGYASFSLLDISGDFQHLWPAPAQQEVAESSALGDSLSESGGANATKTVNRGLRSAREAAISVTEQLTGACAPVTLFAIASSAPITTKEGGSAAARLEALDESAYGLKPIQLLGGRLIYPDEFAEGQRVAMLDEQLAVALFQYAEPLEREIIIAKETYRIVGIVRDHKQVGDEQEYTLYVPYRAIERSSLPLTALCMQASPIPGAGGWAAFSSAVKSLGQGTTWSLSKETMNALMPVRLLGVVLGLAALFTLIRFLNVRFLAFAKAYRARLQEAYALRLLPFLLGRGGLFLLGYGLSAFLFARLFMILIAPVYTFPEWVPAILVEPKDIAAAFWNVWQGSAQLTELRSPELLRIQFFARLLAWASGGAALGSGILWGRLGGALQPFLQREVGESSPAD